MTLMRCLPTLAALLFPTGLASAEAIDPLTEYRTCLTVVQQTPDAGWEEALAWQSLGGGEAARHCAAMALILMGKHDEAAHRLEALAQESRRPEAVRAEMLAQAGQAWMLAGKLDRALAAQTTALHLVPGQPDLMLDRAVTLAQASHYAEAADTLTQLLKAQPNRIEAMTLRASAYRYLDRLDFAREDTARALVLDPDYPDALLERGILRRLDGNEAGAREDWIRIIALAPDSPAAEPARRNLERMDVKAR